jgi:hypothetical protein
MVTLTFSDEAIGAALPSLGRVQWRAFSKEFSRQYKAAAGAAAPSVKWLAVPELGERTGRLHLHAVAMPVGSRMCAGVSQLEGSRVVQVSPVLEVVRKCWPHGFVKCEVITSRGGVRYVLKYSLKGRQAVAAALEEHRRRARVARSHGLALPSFVSAYWVAYPRGRSGGLAASYADAVGEAQPVHARELGDLVAPTRGVRDFTGKLVRRPVVLTRYEKRRGRRVAGLDDEASKLKRAALNPEPVEMAARQLAAGGFDALRSSGGAVDGPEIERARARALLNRSLGRV